MSNLLKMSLALEDNQLNRRVQAAVVLRAQQVSNKTDAEGSFAKLILSDLDRRWCDFIIRVASDAEVQEAIALSPQNDAIYATNVPDTKIQALVNSSLSQNASKYAQPEGGSES